MYKLCNEYGTIVKDLDEGIENIQPGTYLWGKYKKWLAQGNIPIPYQTESELLQARFKAFDTKFKALDAHYEMMKAYSPIPYTPYGGSVSYEFAASKETIWSTKEYFKDIGLDPDSPIPINGGGWDTNDGRSVPFLVRDLTGLWQAIFVRGIQNYEVFKAHALALKTLYENPEKTIADIEAYYFGTGWFY